MHGRMDSTTDPKLQTNVVKPSQAGSGLKWFINWEPENSVSVEWSITEANLL